MTAFGTSLPPWSRLRNGEKFWTGISSTKTSTRSVVPLNACATLKLTCGKDRWMKPLPCAVRWNGNRRTASVPISKNTDTASSTMVTLTQRASVLLLLEPWSPRWSQLMVGCRYRGHSGANNVPQVLAYCTAYPNGLFFLKGWQAPVWMVVQGPNAPEQTI